MNTYRGVDVDHFVLTANYVEPVLQNVHKNLMGIQSYKKQWGDIAQYWLNHIFSFTTLSLLMNAQHAKTPLAAAKALRASQMEEALTFFEPYFVLTAKEGNHESQDIYAALIEIGGFEGYSLPAIRNTDLSALLNDHHGYFVENGLYESEDVQPGNFYDRYFISSKSDRMERFAVGAAMANMMNSENDEQPASQSKSLLVPAKHFDGQDFMLAPAMALAAGQEDGMPIMPQFEKWQTEGHRRGFPAAHVSKSRREMLRFLMAPTLRSLTALDEVRSVGTLSVGAGPFACIRPEIIATEYAATRIAAAIAPRFTLYTSAYTPVASPH